MRLKMLLFFLFFAMNAFGANLTQLQDHFSSVNDYFRQSKLTFAAQGQSIPAYSIHLEDPVVGQMIPFIRLGKDRNQIYLSIPESHIETPENFFVLLSQLGSVLEYPLTVCRSSRGVHKAPQFVELMLEFKNSTFYNSYFHLLDMAPEIESKDLNSNLTTKLKLKHRWNLGYDMAIQYAATYLWSKRDISRTMENLFPNTPIDFKALRRLGAEAEQRIVSAINEKDWLQAHRFLSSLYSKELDHLVKRNNRVAVADYLEKKLPRGVLTEREMRFWQLQIEAIRNPSATDQVYLFRGGDLNFGHDWGYGSRHMRQTPISGKLNWWMDKVLKNLTVKGSMFQHSISTSDNYISTTTDFNVATTFSDRANFLSVVAIDSRRALVPQFGKNWGEDEVLVPLIIFPDEIVSNTDKSSPKSIESQYWKKVQDSQILLKSKKDLDVIQQSYGFCRNLF